MDRGGRTRQQSRSISGGVTGTLRPIVLTLDNSEARMNGPPLFKRIAIERPVPAVTPISDATADRRHRGTREFLLSKSRANSPMMRYTPVAPLRVIQSGFFARCASLPDEIAGYSPEFER